MGGRPLLILVGDSLTDGEFSNLLTTSLTDKSSETVEGIANNNNNIIILHHILEMTLKELANKSIKIQHYKEIIAKHVTETTNDKVRYVN